MNELIDRLVNEAKLNAFVDLIAASDIEFSNLGMVTGGEITIDDESFGHINNAKDIYENAIGKMLE